MTRASWANIRTTATVAVVAAAVSFWVGIGASHPSSAAGLTFSVASYGATPNDGIDDVSGIRAAIAAAKASAGNTLVFPPGTYNVNSLKVSTDQQYLVVQSATNLTLSGPGAELLFSEPKARGLTIQQSSGVIVNGLSIDYAIPPFAQGTIKALDSVARTFDWEIQAGYPTPDYQPFGSATWSPWGTLHDPTTGLLKARSADLYEVTYSLTPVATRTYRMQLPAYEPVDAQVGDGFVLPMRPAGTTVQGMFVFRSPNTVLDGVTVYAAPGSAIESRDSDATVIRNSAIKVREGSGRWISNSSDGVHVTRGRRGPTIDNTLISRNHDDAINITQPPAEIRTVDLNPGSATFNRLISVANAGYPQAGDLVQIFDAVNGVVRGSARIAVATPPGTGGMWTFTLDRPIIGMQAGSDFHTADHVEMRSQIGFGFAITNNTIENTRARGIVIRAEEGYIASNVIRNHAIAGIYIENEPAWPEGVIPRNILVQGNTIEDVGWTRRWGAYSDAAAIRVRTARLDGNLAQSRAVANVTLTYNTIKNPPRNAIDVGAATDIRIEQTTVTVSAGAYVYPGISSIIRLESSDHVVLEGLAATDAGSPLHSCVTLVGSMSTADVTASDLALNGSACTL